MAFGQELKDFTASFKTGYDMFDSKEEKEYKKAKRDNDLRSDNDAHEWGTQDRADRASERAYQHGRDTTADTRWDKSFAQQQGRAERSDMESDRSYEFTKAKTQWDIDKDKLSLAREAGGGNAPVIPDGGYPAPAAQEGAIPESAGGGTDELRGGSGNDRLEGAGSSSSPTGGPAIASRMVQDLGRDFGMPQDIAIGVVGQLAGETGGFKEMQELSPTVKGSRGGFGYAQWTGPRRRQFEAYADAKGLDPRSYEANYGFFRHELANTSEGSVIKKLHGARDSQSAGRIFTDGFLRPGIPNYQGRARWTDRVGGLFGGGKKAVRAAVGGMITEQDAPPFDDDDPLNDRPIEEGEGDDMIMGGSGEDQVQEAIPSVPRPTPRPDYDGASQGDAEEPTKDANEASRRGVRDGLAAAQTQSGLNTSAAIDDPELERQRQYYLKGYGAAPAQMMKQAQDKVDPDKKMSPAERNMKAIGTVYQYYMQNGEPEKAKSAAASMVQYHRSAANNFLALAQAAAEKGDLDNAAKAAVAGYANIPNGRDMQIVKKGNNYEVSVTDIKTGKPIHKEVVAPDKFAEAAMGFNPGTFDDEILSASGQKAPEHETASPSDREEIGATISGALSEEGAVPEGFDPKAVEFAANNIVGLKENGFNSSQATQVLKGMLMDPNAEGVDQFKSTYEASYEPGSSKKVVNVKTAQGDTFKMSAGAFNRINEMRLAKLKEATDAATKAEADGKASAANSENLSKGLAAAGEGISNTLDAGMKLFSRDGMRSAREGAQQRAAASDDLDAPPAAETAIPESPQEPGVVTGGLRELGRKMEGDTPGNALGVAGAANANATESDMLQANGQKLTPAQEVRQLTLEARSIQAQPGALGRKGQQRLSEIEARLQELQPEAIPTR